MFTVRNVMAAIDFSEASMRALAYGKNIALEFNGSLCVAHIIPLSIPTFYAYSVPSSEWQAKHELEADGRMRALFSQEDIVRLRARFMTRCGHVDDELLQLIDETKVDLLVMGSHGRRVFETWFLGSISAQMLRKAPVPILTATHTQLPTSLSFKRIIAATDLSNAALSAVKTAAGVARAFGGQLTVLHVVENGNEGPAGLTRLDQSEIDGVDMHEKAIAGIPHQAIVRYAEENDFDLIVLALQGKAFVHRALLGSTAERVIRSTHLPVLSVPYFGQA